MSYHRNDLLDMHPVAVIGSLLGARPQGPAPRDAEPEDIDEPRQSFARRLAAAYRARRAAPAHAETGRA